MAGQGRPEKVRSMNLKERINGLGSSREIIYLDSTTSTNDYARLVSAEKEDPHGIVVVADTQSHGRGRLGREWVSPPRVNLYFTIIVVPGKRMANPHLIGLAAAVAAASGIRNTGGLDAQIKWPNDIMIKGRKTGGVLAETSFRGDRLYIFIGIGLNVNMPESLMPQDIRPLATSLMIESGRNVDRLELLLEVLRRFDISYEMLTQKGAESVIAQWKSMNCTLGRQISVKTAEGVINSTATGITSRGELIVELPSGEKEYLRAGDVTILKDTAGGAGP
jgi:BirA family biotin operon repressor/biotin-[acetyl-CoA-carboxylase] ligase